MHKMRKDKKMNNDVYVVKNGDNWGVRTAGSDRLYRVCATQAEAIEIGRALAIARKSELRIQGRDGKFHKSNSYGNESGVRDKNW